MTLNLGCVLAILLVYTLNAVSAGGNSRNPALVAIERLASPHRRCSEQLDSIEGSVVSTNELRQSFESMWKGAKPFVLKRGKDCIHNQAISAMRAETEEANVANEWARTPVVLAGSSSFNSKQKESTLGSYIQGLSKRARQMKARLQSENWMLQLRNSSESALYDYYLFGDTLNPQWNQLQGMYGGAPSHFGERKQSPQTSSQPTTRTGGSSLVPPCIKPEEEPLPTLGIGGLYSGVQFHTHGAAWAEVLHGSKLWLLAPPSQFQSPGDGDVDGDGDSDSDASSAGGLGLGYGTFGSELKDSVGARSEGLAAGRDSAARSNASDTASQPRGNDGSPARPSARVRDWIRVGPWDDRENQLETTAFGGGATLRYRPKQGMIEWVLRAGNQTSSEADPGVAWPAGVPGATACVLEPCEILYIPSQWWHATLNLEDYNVFVSTFVREIQSKP